MSQRLGQSQKTNLKLSPHYILIMKLLQVPTAQLEQRVDEEIESNPALEEGDTYDDNFGSDNDQSTNDSDEIGSNEVADTVDDYAEYDEIPVREDTYELDDYMTRYLEDDPDTYRTKGDPYNPDQEDKSMPMVMDNTFHEYLESQIGMLRLADEREMLIAQQIIGSIDEHGYLQRSIADMTDDLQFKMNVKATEAEVELILARIQLLDPPGVGARTLQECLLIQLRAKLEMPDISDDDRFYLKIAIRIITDCFEEFTRKHYAKMQRQLGIEEEILKAANDEILKLNPKPASGYAGDRSRGQQYIIPDFIVETVEGQVELRLDSRNIPDLRISEQYKDMLKGYRTARDGRDGASRQQKEAVVFIKQKIESARWFIDAIRQREQTMLKTMQAILYYQEDYFLTGDEKKLRPMILKDVADTTGLDISTISRVANAKFVQTEYGIKRLKDFFSESLQNDAGEEVSTLEVKKILTEIIQAENKRKPYSDEKLKTMLLKKGYNIARRTVAKYREQLNLPVARLRKAL
jgi:RNA polymerase sigma-54 factor